jgi:PAS domain S-box-containing protein
VTNTAKAEIAQDDLSDAEQRLRSIVEHVVDGIISCDEQCTIGTFNQAAERLFGYSSLEVIGRNVTVLMPDPYQREHDGHLQNYIRTGHASIIGIGREVVGRRKDGSVFPMELAISEFNLRGQRHFTGIVRDITERKRLEHELQEKLHELTEGDRQKNEFLAMLGHELRNPLAPIRNAIHILKMPTVTSAVSEWALDMMDRQVQQVVHLVDDLLDVARIVHGKIELHHELIDLCDPVRLACEAAAPEVEARGHQFSVHLPPLPVWVKGDRTRLAQVIANLLNNAAKYTDGVGSVALTVKQEDQSATVTVRDSGVGISPELLPRMFDIFVQGHRSSERSREGLGIGLTLAKRLIELHNGSISAFSAGAGRGSEFVVALPLAPSPSAANFDATRLSQPGGRVSASKVLVVDDNLDGCESTATILRDRGYEVRCLHDGSSVLSAALQWRPDAIVLDIGLPKMNGLEVAAQLRQRAEFAHIALIALTGYGQESDRLRSMRAGFNLHLTKPVDPQVLDECVSRLLKRSAIPANPC